MSSSKMFKLPDTGQVKCYDREGQEIDPQPGDELYGQDGCFSIHPMSFAKLDGSGKNLPDTATWEDGLRMILDRNTGLVWEVKSPYPADVNYMESQYTWQDALDGYVTKLNKQKYGGFDDWRIPNKDELRSIVDYSKSAPAIDAWYFPHCQIGQYWCSVTYEMQPYLAWTIFFGLGSGIVISKTNPCYVRATRGGYSTSFGKPDLDRFVDNGDGTITDRVTGLMWQKGENERMNWYNALQYCQNMRLAGYDDWRLPNLKELNTILDISYKDGWWFYNEFFPADGLQPPLLHYFSSSVFEKTYAWVTNFSFGYDGYYANKNATLLFRAVRNINPPEIAKPQFKLPDTGQTFCYDDEGNRIETPKPGERFYGQDGTIGIYPPSFTRLREGGKELEAQTSWEQGWRMILDRNTGLMWEVKSPNTGDINYKGARYNWRDAQYYIERLNKQNYGGFDDWRLPNREELRAIVDYNGPAPAVDRVSFPTILPDFYWSKDQYVADLKMIWGIYFAYGCGICYLKDNLYFVLAVRGGYNLAFGDTARYTFKANGDGTVTDLNTNLMWKQEESPALNMVETLKYCEDLRLGGYADWRLPNIKEMATLVDLSYKDAVWFHAEFFPNVETKPRGFYSSSTTFGTTFGWGVNYQFGYDGYYADKKDGYYPFRPVRNVK